MSSSLTSGIGDRRRNEAIGVIVVTMIGVLLRVPALKIGLWRDEGATYFDILPATLSGVLDQVATSELNPPGFFLLMNYWTQVFGSGEVAFKLPAFVFGALLIPVTYALARTATDSPRIALFASGVAALAPEAVYYSQEARPYTLTALLCSLTVLFFLRATAKRDFTAAMALAVCAGLSLYVHYTSLLLIGSLATVTAALAAGRRLPGRWLLVGVALFLAGVLFAPWISVFLTHLATGTPWATKAPLWQRPLLVYDNLLYTFPFPVGGAWDAFRKAAALIVVSALAAGILRWRDSAATSRDVTGDRIGVVTAILVLVTAMLAGLSYSRRYMFPFAPLAWVVAIWCLVQGFDALREWSNRWNRWAVPLLASVLTLVWSVPAVAYALALDAQPKSGFRALAADLPSMSAVRTMHLLTPDVFASTLGYYMRDVPFEIHGIPRWSRPEVFSPIGYQTLWEQPTLIDDVTARVAEKAAQGCHRLALIQPTGGIRDAGQLPMSRAQEVLEVLRARYPLIETRQYAGTLEPVTLYVFALSPPSQVVTSSRTRF